jgi:hypothetical protein
MPRIGQTQRPTADTRLLTLFALAAAILFLLPFTPILTGHHFAFTALFPAGRTYEDITVYRGRFTLYHTRRFFLLTRGMSAFAYPPAAAPIYELFSRTSRPAVLYLAIAAVWTAILSAITFTILAKASTIRTAASIFLRLAFLSFPLIFLLQRANIELFLWILIALALLAYRKSYAIPAAILIGIAAAIKLYPIFLLGLFLHRKKDLPAFAVGLLTAILTIAAAIAYAGPTFSIAAHGFFTGVDRFQDHNAETVRSAEINFDHSLFSPIKYWFYLQHQTLRPWLTPYYLAAATIAGALYLRVRTLPFLNRTIFLITAMIALPPVSYTYTLVHLYLPTILLLAALLATTQPTTAKPTLILLLFLLLPLVALSTFFAIPAGPIQTVAVFLLLPLAAIFPWPDPTTNIPDL